MYFDEKTRFNGMRTHLIQRLTAPPPPPKDPNNRLVKLLGDNPFAFGGGLINGGFSKQAMSHLKVIFGFDYMGAAEFEWGAVPKALEKIASQELTTFTMNVTGTAREQWKKLTNKLDKNVYAIVPKALSAKSLGSSDRVYDGKEYVAEVVKQLISGRHEDLKEPSRMADVLFNVKEPGYQDVIGWLELDNGFFMFADKTAFDKTCELFGLTVSV